MAGDPGAARRRGGAIDVVSQVGEGTVFRILLPAPHAGEASGEPVGEASKGCVMLVDDDGPVREVSSKLVRRRGWACVALAGGADALEHARSDAKIDVAVLDCHLEDLLIDDLLAKLRELRPGLPVLLISGMPSADERLLRGAKTDFLGKPFRVEELDRRLSELLASG